MSDEERQEPPSTGRPLRTVTGVIPETNQPQKFKPDTNKKKTK
ncbi:hypothetical protein [Brunnivagina elsteri]|nr:hypothetical protein [Calothrix elsteri]